MPLLHWLTWDEDLRAADRVPYRLLDEVPELSRGGVYQGLLAQGDNLEALKALLPFYAGRGSASTSTRRATPAQISRKSKHPRTRSASTLASSPRLGALAQNLRLGPGRRRRDYILVRGVTDIDDIKFVDQALIV